MSVCILGAVLALGSPFSVGDASAVDAPGKLRNGFTVATGSRLLAPAFPVGLIKRDPQQWSGWTAYLDVTGEAGPVFDAYVGQARRLGYRVDYSDKNCRASSPGDVECSATLLPDTMQFAIDLRVCTTCSIPISRLTLTMISATGRPTTGPPLPQNPPPSAFTVRLTDAMRARQRAALPGTGKTIPFGHSYGDPLAPLSVAPGVRAVGVWESDCIDGGFTAVLRSDRPVGDVFDEYRNQVKRQANENPPSVARHKGAAEVQGDYASATVVGRGDGSAVLLGECFGD
jgi:hypothetical protein